MTIVSSRSFTVSDDWVGVWLWWIAFCWYWLVKISDRRSVTIGGITKVNTEIKQGDEQRCVVDHCICRVSLITLHFMWHIRFLIADGFCFWRQGIFSRPGAYTAKIYKLPLKHKEPQGEREHPYLTYLAELSVLSAALTNISLSVATSPELILMYSSHLWMFKDVRAFYFTTRRQEMITM